MDIGEEHGTITVEPIDEPVRRTDDPAREPVAVPRPRLNQSLSQAEWERMAEQFKQSTMRWGYEIGE